MNITKEQLERKLLLVKALCSGKYKQTYGYLEVVSSNDPDTYPVGNCCLGVACKLYEEQGFQLGERKETRDTSENFGRITVYVIDNRSYCSMLPSDVQDWFGFSSPYGDYFYGGDDIVTLNDSKKCSFSEIADFLEKSVFEKAKTLGVTLNMSV